MAVFFDKAVAAVRTLSSGLTPATEILAVEVGGDQLLAAVVRRRGRHTRILDFASIDRRNAGEDLPDSEDLKQIAQRLSYNGDAVVLASQLARTIQISVNAVRAKKLKSYQLAESMRWEVEPYTGINGVHALVGVEKEQTEVDAVLLALEGESEVDVNVAVIEKNVFLALRQICKKAGLKLRRVYSPEVCFYVPALNGEEARAVLDIGNDLSSFALLRGKSPKQISAYPVGRESIRDILDGQPLEEMESSLRYVIEQTPQPLPLLVTGHGTLDKDIIAWLDELSPTGAAGLQLKRENKLSDTSHDSLNAVFATAVGAAMRELGGGRLRRLGITDVVPLPLRLKNSAYLMPLVVAALLAATLFGHYQWMVIEKHGFDERIKELSAGLQGKQQKEKAFKREKKRLDGLREEIALAKNRISFVTGGSDDNLSELIDVLFAFTLLPENMTLEKIEQQQGCFRLSGIAAAPQNVSRFAVRIQQEPWCRSVSIETLEFSSDAFIFTLRLEVTDAKTDKT